MGGGFSLSLPPELVRLVVRCMEEDVSGWVQQAILDTKLQTEFVRYLDRHYDNLELKKCLAFCGNVEAMQHFSSTIWICQKEDWCLYFQHAHHDALEYIFSVTGHISETDICTMLCDEDNGRGIESSENLKVIAKHVNLTENAKNWLFAIACYQQNIDVLDVQLNVLKWKLKNDYVISITAVIWPILEPHVLEKNIEFFDLKLNDIQSLTAFELKTLSQAKILPSPQSIADVITCYEAFSESNMHIAEFFWEPVFRDVVGRKISDTISASLLCKDVDDLFLLDSVCEYVQDSTHVHEFLQLCKDTLCVCEKDMLQQKNVQSLSHFFTRAIKMGYPSIVRWLWPIIAKCEIDMTDFVQKWIIAHKDVDMIPTLMEVAPSLVAGVAKQLAIVACETSNDLLWKLLCDKKFLSQQIIWRIASQHWNTKTPKTFLHSAFPLVFEEPCSDRTLLERLIVLAESKQNQSMHKCLRKKKNLHF